MREHAAEQYPTEQYLPTGKGRRIVKILRPFFFTRTAFAGTKAILIFVDMPSLRSARYIRCFAKYIRCFAKYIRKTTNSICFRYAQTRYDINPRSRSEHIELLMVHSCHQQYIERVSVYRKSAFADLYRWVPALWQVPLGGGFLIRLFRLRHGGCCRCPRFSGRRCFGAGRR